MKRKLLSICLILALLASMAGGGVLAMDDQEAEAMIAADALPEGVDPDDPMYFKVMHPDQWAQIMEGEDLSDMPEDGVTAPRLEATPVSYETAKPRALKSGETLRKGIDVSVWQDDIDWKAVAGSGVEFAIIRAGYRGWGLPGTLAKDTTFRANILGARENGILVGAYIFSQAITEEEGREEARFLMDQLSGIAVDLPLVLDFEYAGSYGRLYNAKLSKADATAICNAFCDEVEKQGYESMVYANPSMLYNQLNPGELGRVWLANYIDETDYDGDYEYWQFTSSGKVPGISGSVDLNFWFDPGETEENPFPFRDVPKNAWFYETVKTAYEDGIVYGTSETTFSPSDKVTRGQLVTLLYRMVGSPAVTAKAPFQDLTADWYADAVHWAWQNGVVNGTSETTFAPNNNITRQDLTTILYRNAGSPAVTGNELAGFPDAGNASDYARDALEWAVENHIMNGSDGQIKPRDTATRAEACALLIRYRDYLG